MSLEEQILFVRAACNIAFELDDDPICDSCAEHRAIRDATIASLKKCGEYENAIAYFLNDIAYKAPEQIPGVMEWHIARFRKVLNGEAV